MKELVEYLVKAMVEKPDQVGVREREGEQTIILELTVAKEDIGRVIGKEGRIINSLRLLLNASATVQGKKKVSLEIIE